MNFHELGAAALRDQAAAHLRAAIASEADPATRAGETADSAALCTALLAYANVVDALDARETRSPWADQLVRRRVVTDQFVVLLACGHWTQTRNPHHDTWKCPVCPRDAAPRPAAQLGMAPAVLHTLQADASSDPLKAAAWVSRFELGTCRHGDVIRIFLDAGRGEWCSTIGGDRINDAGWVHLHPSDTGRIGCNDPTPVPTDV